jgi:hypothetical protein
VKSYSFSVLTFFSSLSVLTTSPRNIERNVVFLSWL